MVEGAWHEVILYHLMSLPGAGVRDFLASVGKDRASV